MLDLDNVLHRLKKNIVGDSVYLFTNENIGYYMPRLNLNGRDVLTVASSGDHAFQAYLCGARHVDTFDRNYNQKYVIDVKKNMIRTLNYDEFIDHTIKSDWSATKMAKRDIRTAAKIARLNLAGHNCAPQSFLTKYIPYLNDAAAYNKLKSVLPKKINFIHCDIIDLVHALDQKYDVILLSNIAAHACAQYNMFPDEFLARVVKPLADHALNKNGCICWDYGWGFEQDIKFTDAEIQAVAPMWLNSMMFPTTRVAFGCRWDGILTLHR